jgi:hypothetical protein
VKYQVKHEFVDKETGQRVGVGAIVELTAERAQDLQSRGVGLELIRETPTETATAPASEKAVNAGGRRSKGA